MPPLLGAADSFNSSSATIRPDDNQRRSFQRTGGLGPADSVGRELNAIIDGHVGVLQSDPGASGNTVLSSYLQSYRATPTQNPNEHISENAATGSNSAALSRLPSEFNPLAFLNDPSGGAGGTFFDGLNFEQSTPAAAPTFDHTASNSSNVPAAIQTPALYRPSSSHSHRSRHSLSSTDVDTDSGFYTTDMDTDDAEGSFGPSPAPNPVSEIDGLNLNPAFSPMSPYSATGASPAPLSTISPDAEGLGARRPSTTKRARTGPVDEEQGRLERLEHRRSINRRSAQKHRLRRKEELETLSRQVAERDLKIAELEKELAVSRAQLQQLLNLMRPRMANAAESK